MRCALLAAAAVWCGSAVVVASWKGRAARAWRQAQCAQLATDIQIILASAQVECTGHA
jgi:hypothetical protein